MKPNTHIDDSEDMTLELRSAISSAIDGRLQEYKDFLGQEYTVAY